MCGCVGPGSNGTTLRGAHEERKEPSLDVPYLSDRCKLFPGDFWLHVTPSTWAAVWIPCPHAVEVDIFRILIGSFYGLSRKVVLKPLEYSVLLKPYTCEFSYSCACLCHLRHGRAQSISCFLVTRLWGQLPFQASKDCWTEFFSPIFNNSKLFGIHYINLGKEVEQAFQAPLVWNKKEDDPHIPLSIFIKTVHFFFSF